MKKFNSNALLDQLENDTRQIILALHQIKQQDPEILLTNPESGKWSIVEVIEHLNIYGRYYLPRIRRITHNALSKAEETFTPGWLGNYFTNSMLPDKNGMIKNKMSSPKMSRPPAGLDSHTVLNEFLQQEEELLDLLQLARKVSLNKIRVPISIAQFIKLKLGDIFRFNIAHHQRHFVQIQNTLAAVKKLKAA